MYERILTAFYSQPWALLPVKLLEVRALLETRARGERVPPEEIERVVQAAEARRPSGMAPGSAKVAVLPVFGVMAQRAGGLDESSGYLSTERVGKQFDALINDPGVRAVVLNIDSPGGSVYGVSELAQKVYDARGQKKVVALANSMAASGAYWLASQADELCVTPGGSVGSIGVFAAHEDASEMMKALGVSVTLVSAGKYKTEGNPYGPLDDDARANMQEQVDQYYGMFADAVARGRGTTAAKVRAGYGQGRMVLGKAAVAEGMADRVGTLEDVLGRLGVAGMAGGPSATAVPVRRISARIALAAAE